MSQWNPNDYHQHSSQQQKWARDILDKLALTGHEQILDIGCGDGKITAEVARCVPNGLAVGLDSSAEMIEFARQSFPADTLPRLRFEQGDARQLEFVEQFDGVISFACLHWILDHRPVLAGIHRALRPSGRLLLQFGGQGNAAEMVQVIVRRDRPSEMGWLLRWFHLPLAFLRPGGLPTAAARSWTHGNTPVKFDQVSFDLLKATQALLDHPLERTCDYLLLAL